MLRALIGLLPSGAEVRGSIRLKGQELVGVNERAWRAVRGREVAVVLRDPGVALDRTVRIGAQVAETLKLHQRVKRREVAPRVAALLDEVGLPESVARCLPRDLSADDGRRAMLASALAGNPSLLLVDDGPASLTTEQHVAFGSLVAAISRARGLASVVFSHQIAALAPFADEIGVLCGGLIMEQTTPWVLATSPRVPYTSELLRAVPEVPAEPAQPEAASRSPERAFGVIRLPPSGRQQPPARPAVAEHLLIGCSYSLRCPRAVIPCREHEPVLVEEPAGHRWACWNPQPAP